MVDCGDFLRGEFEVVAQGCVSNATILRILVDCDDPFPTSGCDEPEETIIDLTELLSTSSLWEVVHAM